MSLFLLLSLNFTVTAFAGGHFAIDPNVNVAALETAIDADGTERIALAPASQETRGKYITRDASAVLRNVDFNRLFAAAKNFNQYKAMGMPYLLESKIVETPNPQTLITYNDMSSGVLSSQHFYNVQLRTQGDGMEWEQIRPGSSRYRRAQGGFYSDDPKFSKQVGSWYMERLPSGNVYVRYYASVIVDAPLIPNGVIARHAGPMFERGAKAVIKKLAARARVRQANP